MSTRAAIYARISSDDGSALGVGRQLQDCEQEAKRRGWVVADNYVDNDVSASRGAPRPEYERMLAHVRAGHLGAIVVWDVDRLTRTPRELEDVIDFADKHRLKLASVGGEIDLSTEQGRLTARLKGDVARYEVEQSSRRLKRKAAELVAAGAPNGPRPYGYDRVRVDGVAQNVINPAEAAMVREAAERVLAGEGLWRIVNDLTARGYVTQRGGPWQTQTLRRALLKPALAGLRTYRGKIVGEAAWEPILDRATFDRLTAKLTDPARRTSNRGTAVRYLLSGIALCGKCHRSMVGTARFEYTYRTFPNRYVCNHAGCHGVSKKMQPIDEYIEAVVVAILQRDGVRLLGGDKTAARAAREEVETLKAKLSLAADQFAEDAITADQLARITARLRPALDDARHRLAAAQPADEFARFATGDVATAWGEADIQIKRAIINLLMTITIDPSGPGNPTSTESVRVDWKRDRVPSALTPLGGGRATSHPAGGKGRERATTGTADLGHSTGNGQTMGGIAAARIKV